jgi:hypothetical protein
MVPTTYTYLYPNKVLKSSESENGRDNFLPTNLIICPGVRIK